MLFPFTVHTVDIYAAVLISPAMRLVYTPIMVQVFWTQPLSDITQTVFLSALCGHVCL